MFNDDRSDFAAPIAGFLYMGFVAAIIGIFLLNVQCGFCEWPYLGITYYVGIIGLIIAAFNLYKADLAEGFSFGLTALLILAVGDINITYSGSLGSGYYPITFIGLGILFGVVAVVSYLSGYLDLTVINGVLGFGSLIIGFDSGVAIYALPAILLLIVAMIAIYVAICDWQVAQEVLDAYEEDFCCCEDDDGCCCDDENCCCDDENCCCEKSEAEPEASEPAAEPVAESEPEKTENSQ